MTVMYPKEICSMCGNYLDDDMKCYECEDCNMKHSTEDAFDIGDTITVTTDTSFDGHYDDVNNPKHYNSSGLECIEAIEAIGLPDPIRMINSFNSFNSFSCRTAHFAIQDQQIQQLCWGK